MDTRAREMADEVLAERVPSLRRRLRVYIEAEWRALQLKVAGSLAAGESRRLPISRILYQWYFPHEA